MSSMKKGSTNSQPTAHPTIRLWVDVVPKSWRPFVQLSRIDMIDGALLMFWPAIWGAMGSAYRTNLSPMTLSIQIPLYFVGSILLHGAACTWNDVCDKEIDSQVERTKHRPLPAGTVSIFAAMIFIFLQVSVLVGLLLLTNQTAFQVGVLGLCLWQPIYPFMKRVTYWPQAWLGFVMNWGVIIAWVTNTGSLDNRVDTTLFFGSCCWTLHYVSIYAMQDKDVDVQAGMKTTPALFVKFAKPIISLFCFGFIASLSYFGILNEHGPVYYVLTVFGTSAHLVWQVVTLNINDPKSCFARFDANGRHVGIIVASGMMADYALKTYSEYLVRLARGV